MVKQAANLAATQMERKPARPAENRESAWEGKVPAEPIFDVAGEERFPTGRFNSIFAGPGWVLALSFRSS
jgi:hypothetical protein